MDSQQLLSYLWYAKIMAVMYMLNQIIMQMIYGHQAKLKQLNLMHILYSEIENK